MQDKEKIDAEFLDSAWANMHSQLDEHMPVQQSRRRGFLYWRWAAAAAVLLLLSIPTCWYLQDQPSTDLTTNSHIAEQETSTRAQDEETFSASFPDPTSEQADGTPLTAPKANSANASPSLPGSPNQQELVQIPNKNKTEAQKQDVNIGRQPKDRTDIAQNESEDSIIALTPNEINPTRSIYEDQTIATLIAKPLALKERSAPSLSIEKVKVPAAFFAEANIFASPPNDLTGFSVGIGRQATLTNKLKWNIGLNYRYMRWSLKPDTTGNRFFSTRADEVLSASGTPISGGSSGTTILARVAKEHTVELPLSLTYQAGNRWQLNGGMAISYSLGSYAGDIRVSADDAQNFDTVEQNVFNDIAEASLAWYGGNSDTRIVKEQLNVLRLDAMLGVQYRLATHWGVQLQGRYSITPPLKRNFGTLDQYNFGAGVRYYFR